MSRLINTDVLIEDLKKWKGLDDKTIEAVIETITNQPTAFDTEQVIHNLEREKTIWCGRKITTTEVMKIDDAIDIVRKGGV